MPNVSYHTFGGRIVASGVAARTVMLPDALGSVVRTLNQGGGGRAIRYAGYGSPLYNPRNADMPRNTFVGRLGYRRTDLKHAEQYVRARHLATTEGNWTTVDPLWPYESAFGYVKGMAINRSDPSGLRSIDCAPGTDPLADACKNINALTSNNFENPLFKKVSSCMSKKYKGRDAQGALKKLLSCMAANCNSQGGRIPLFGPCVICFKPGQKSPYMTDECKAVDPCDAGRSGATIKPGPYLVDPPVKGHDYSYGKSGYVDCGYYGGIGRPGNPSPDAEKCLASLPATSKALCSTIMLICNNSMEETIVTVMHELIHSCGPTHYGFGGSDYITDLDRCMCSAFYGESRCKGINSCH